MHPLLISVPSYELNRMGPFGSVFDATRLKNAPFSAGLKCALQVVEESLGPQYSQVLCVARPEMFTHGESVAWLNERVHGAQDHLYLSNGQAIKSLPGFNNSVFVYGLDRQAGFEQFRSLLRRAPEFWGQFTSQVNSHHTAVLDSKGTPPTARVALLQSPLPKPELSWHYPFYMNRHSNGDSAERMMKWDSCEWPDLSGYNKLTIMLCGESALHDTYYCHALADAVIEASRQPKTCLMLHLPSFENEEGGTLQRIGALLDGLRRSGQVIPRVRMDNVLLMTDVSEIDFQNSSIPFDLVLHETSPAWQFTQAFYAKAHDVHLYCNRKSGAKSAQLAVLETLIGRKPTMHPWTLKFLAKQGIE